MINLIDVVKEKCRYVVQPRYLLPEKTSPGNTPPPTHTHTYSFQPHTPYYRFCYLPARNNHTTTVLSPMQLDVFHRLSEKAVCRVTEQVNRLIHRVALPEGCPHSQRTRERANTLPCPTIRLSAQSENRSTG